MPKSANPLLRRKSSASPLKPPARKPSTTAPEERLDDTGIPPSLAPRAVAQDVQTLIRHVLFRTFEPIPERAAGMGSERISDTLRFRDGLPKVVSVAHLHALSASPTATERELAGLMARGLVRKVIVPGRGKGGAAVGEGVVLVEDWKSRVGAEVGLSEGLKDRYMALIDANPTSPIVQTHTLSKEDVRHLVQSGFLTSPTALSSSLTNLFASPTNTSSIAQSGHRAPTGSLAAIGGAAAIHESGGSGSMLATKDTRLPASSLHGQTMTFSLPSTGAYLELLTTARSHLLALLKQLAPRFREATWDLLREKWDGNSLRDSDAAGKRKRERGEWSGVLPGKTRKWREFRGLRFEWVLHECVGAGLVEVFDTGVGMWGVRAT